MQYDEQPEWPQLRGRFAYPKDSTELETLTIKPGEWLTLLAAVNEMRGALQGLGRLYLPLMLAGLPKDTAVDVGLLLRQAISVAEHLTGHAEPPPKVTH